MREARGVALRPRTDHRGAVRDAAAASGLPSRDNPLKTVSHRTDTHDIPTIAPVQRCWCGSRQGGQREVPKCIPFATLPLAC
jgi:hypothetical protein